MDRKGITLVEVIIAIAIVALIITLAFSLQIFGVRSFTTGTLQADMQQTARQIDEIIRNQSNIRNTQGIGDGGIKKLSLENNKIYYSHGKFFNIDSSIDFDRIDIVLSSPKIDVLKYKINIGTYELTNRLLLNNINSINSNKLFTDGPINLKTDALYYTMPSSGFTDPSYFSINSNTNTILRFCWNLTPPSPEHVHFPTEIDGTTIYYIGSGAFDMDHDGGSGYGGLTRPLQSIVIPEGIKVIRTSAFKGNNLTLINLPNSINNVQAGAFENNSLTEITIGSGVDISSHSDTFGDHHGFRTAYLSGGAGKYIWNGSNWLKQ